jgi:hypothetical protein
LAWPELLSFGVCDQHWGRDLIRVGEVVLAGRSEHIEGGLQAVRFCAPLPVLPLYRRRFLHPFQDLVVCAVTDGQGAANEPVRAKVTRIVVTGVGQEQKVALSVTAWEIPY